MSLKPARLIAATVQGCSLIEGRSVVMQRKEMGSKNRKPTGKRVLLLVWHESRRGSVELSLLFLIIKEMIRGILLQVHGGLWKREI